MVSRFSVEIVQNPRGEFVRASDFSDLLQANRQARALMRELCTALEARRDGRAHASEDDRLARAKAFLAKR